MTLAIIREFQFPADKRFHVKLTPMASSPSFLAGKMPAPQENLLQHFSQDTLLEVAKASVLT
ncbi:MAG: hypothetical protein V7K77_02615 [Nostoc sp.]|uniref:hypothetical protein n=1 Tax=Nostoc sp. TaxID=1180 RepID=UPI002FF84627